MRRRALTTGALLMLLCAGLAQGELIQSGDLRLDFRGKFAPQALPRYQPAPVSVHVGGSIATVDGSRPPQLRRISVAVNRYGRVSTQGLPSCESGSLEQTSSELALSRCRSALVGHGRFAATVDFPSIPAFPVDGEMLAFNSRNRGHAALLLHIYVSTPVKTTVVLTFNITHPTRGHFGTVFTARIPKIASDLGYVTDASLVFDRRYRYAGEARSFVSARCAAPPGFYGGPFSFTRGSFTFANGQRLTVTLTRSCRVAS